MFGRLRSPRRTSARTAGGLLVVGAAGALLLGGATPAGAQPVPTPSPSVSTSPGLSVHVDLGPLDVHVDVPPLTSLLGGVPTPATTRRQPAVVVPADPTSAPRTAAPRTKTPVTRRAVPRPTSTPSRPTATPSARGGGGAGVDSGRDVTPVGRTSPRSSQTPRRTVTRQQLAEATDTFSRALHPGAPAWLLLSVVGLCALGTAGFVRLAGRKDRARV